MIGNNIEINSIHRTSTGKTFEMMDANRNPADYKDNIEPFLKSKAISWVNVGQEIECSDTGMILKRIG